MNTNRQHRKANRTKEDYCYSAVLLHTFKRIKEHSLLLVKFSSLLYSTTNFPTTFNATEGRVTVKPLICFVKVLAGKFENLTKMFQKKTQGFTIFRGRWEVIRFRRHLHQICRTAKMGFMVLATFATYFTHIQAHL